MTNLPLQSDYYQDCFFFCTYEDMAIFNAPCYTHEVEGRINT